LGVVSIGVGVVVWLKLESQTIGRGNFNHGEREGAEEEWKKKRTNLRAESGKGDHPQISQIFADGGAREVAF
jgi:hypothetical protein